MISIPSDVNGHPNVVSLRDPSYHESRNQAHWVVDASSMETNPSVESNVSLPATSSRTTQKRLRRAKLSCLECRRKKVGHRFVDLFNATLLLTMNTKSYRVIEACLVKDVFALVELLSALLKMGLICL